MHIGQENKRFKDNTIYPMRTELVVKGVSETACLISAYEKHIVPVMETHSLQIVDDLTVVSFDLLRIFCLFFLVGVAAERKIFFWTSIPT